MDAPVGAVGADRGESGVLVALPCQQQRIRQRHLVAAPAGQVVQPRFAQRRRQFPQQVEEPRLQRVHIRLAEPVKRLAGLCELVIPGVQVRRGGPALEQRVALPQRPRIPSPDGEKSGFHVEQPPIREAPPHVRRAADQGVATGFKRDHRQGRAQFTQLGDAVAVEAAAPVVPAVPQAGLALAPGHCDRCSVRCAGARGRFVPLDKHLQRGLAGANEPIAHAAAKAPPVGHEVQGFQNAGFSGAVLAGEEVDSRGGPQLNVVERTQVTDVQTRYAHTGGPLRNPMARNASRPGKPGVRESHGSTWNIVARSTGVAASPRGDTARCRLRAPAPRSWRRVAPARPSRP